MNRTNRSLLCLSLFISVACSVNKGTTKPNGLTTLSPIQGSWKLISSQTIVNGDTTLIDYTKDFEGIKIINDTHFSFFQHDVKKGRDSAARFTSGGGKYLLRDNAYTEFLEYCSDKNWENNKFDFTVKIKNDSLIQTGIERVPSLQVDRVIIETYVRANNKNTPVPMTSSFMDDEVSWFATKGKGTIKGLAKFKARGGEIRYGKQFRIELMPFSNYTEDRLHTIYTNKNSGFIYIQDGVPRFIPDPVGYHESTKKTMCNDNGEFEFKELPIGKYYVIAFMLWDQKDKQGNMVKDGGGIMQRVDLKEEGVETLQMLNF